MSDQMVFLLRTNKVPVEVTANKIGEIRKRGFDPHKKYLIIEKEQKNDDDFVLVKQGVCEDAERK